MQRKKMATKDGEHLLREFSKTAYPYEIRKINARIYHITGLGHSNAIAIEGETSWILVDTLDCDTRAIKMRERLTEIADKPVKTIIFTHGHYDHRAGSGVFKDTAEEIIAFSPRRQVLKHYDRLHDVLQKRTVRQFGYTLTDEECISQGIGIREGAVLGEGQRVYLAANIVYEQDVVQRVIDGVNIELVSAVGETDDQLFVWLPDDGVLCCGDNYFGCFPNLYAIRGSQYRDIATWIESLNTLLTYPATALLPGHTRAVTGYETIQDVLGHFRNALEYILLNTLDCMNKGMSESETVEAVKLPKELAEKPYLQEYYGTVEWSVRSVYHGYVGWFDGNPTNLAKLSDRVFDSKIVSLIGEEKLMDAIKQCLEEEAFQMAVQLCDLFIKSDIRSSECSQLKARGLLGLARITTSANGRHYYICYAKELCSSK